MRLFPAYFNAACAGKGYGEEEEYMKDLFAYVDMLLSVALAYRMQDGKGKWEFGIGEKARKGIPVSGEEAIGIFDFKGNRWERPDREEIRMELLRAKAHMIGRLAYTPRRGDSFSIVAMRIRFDLSSLEFFLLFLGLAVCRDTKYEAIFQKLQPEEGKKLPTLRLAFSLFEMTEEISEEEKAKLIQLRGNFFNYLAAAENHYAAAPEDKTFSLLKRVVVFLMGDRNPGPELKGIAKKYSREETLPPILIREAEAEKVKRFIAHYGRDERIPCKMLHLYGERGNGRRFVLRRGAQECGLGVLEVNVTRLMERPSQEMDALLQGIRLECRLTDCIPCFVEEHYRQEDGAAEGEAPREFPRNLDYLLGKIAEEWSFCVWITVEKGTYLSEYPLEFMALESQMLSVGERILLWKAFSKEYRLEEDVDLVLCANQYILTAADIQQVLCTAEMERVSQGRERISRADLLSAVKQRARNQLGGYATLINAVFTWEDLVIDPEQKRQMEMICNQVKFRNVVGEEWGFHEKSPYGKGICALFYGSPGTGKTMSVQVMANELGLDLYRIDLSQMVSKYIGETEKNISALFRKAKNINALLFFDEADSMFAKRSEVKDSNDRNANAETAHLLQKLEDYSGITILATNYVNNIDDAFKRRIKFMVNFVFPGETVRYQLWTTIIPKKIRYEEEIDFEFFAKKFELSGSNIKEILTNAAYIAASEGRGLANRDVVESIRMNFAKYGKILTREDFGYLGVT